MIASDAIHSFPSQGNLWTGRGVLEVYLVSLSFVKFSLARIQWCHQGELWQFTQYFKQLTDYL